MEIINQASESAPARQLLDALTIPAPDFKERLWHTAHLAKQLSAIC